MRNKRTPISLIYKEMSFIPSASTLRKGLLLYRRIRYRKGFGVHSPFVFGLITKVIEEKCPYYSFFDIEVQRKKLLLDNQNITYHDKQNKDRLKTRTIAQITKREAIKPKHGKLLFRLANYFKAEKILQIGGGTGLSTLYLTSYSHKIRCTVLDDRPELANIAKKVFGWESRNNIDIRLGSYKETLPIALDDIGKPDLIFFNTQFEQQDNLWMFNECVKHVNDKSVFVFKGIKDNRNMRDMWREIKTHPDVRITLDLYSMGIVLFNKKLNRRDYKVFF